MFIEADRRETLTILRICLSAALLAVACLPRLPPNLHLWVFGIGVFMFLNAYLSMRVAKRFSDRAVAAAEKAKTAKIPYFSWSSGNGSNKSNGGDT
jgi:hypothetical protein